MLVTQYGIGKPVRISYGEEDPGPRGMFDTASGEFVPYGLWILEKSDGTQVQHPFEALVACVYSKKRNCDAVECIVGDRLH